MTMIERHPCGPRLYLAGRRVHHGLSGAVLAVVALAAHHPRIALVCLIAVVHDARDYPWVPCSFNTDQLSSHTIPQR